MITRGGGGNTARNITASWNAGISEDEVFDVTPYANSLTSRLIVVDEGHEIVEQKKSGDYWSVLIKKG